MRRTLAAAAITAGLAASGGLSAGSTATAAPRLATAPEAQAASTGPTGVFVSFTGGGRAIPRGFFGLSVEYNELKTYERSGALFDRILQMLRPGDGAPLTLRVGGKSADHMLWEPDPRQAPSLKQLPRGVFELGQPWLDDLAALVRHEHLRVILDLNLAVHSPAMAASFVAAVRHALPAGALAGLEIGNEPDMYHFQPHLTRERVATTTRTTPRHWWSNYSSADYRRDYAAYARRLHASLPGIRLGAPDITRPNAPWLTNLTGLGHLDPGFLTIHRYGASGCFAAGSLGYPTISNLLNNVNSNGLAESVAHWVGYAHAHGMGLRVSEINSVSCGRDRGVANAFASALWADDALFAMVDTGVNAVSWHIRPKLLNAPFLLKGKGIIPRPELYALAIFSMMTQGSARILHTSTRQPTGTHLKAWTVRDGGAVKVLLINKGWHTLRVSLRAGDHRTAVLRRLTAPGVRATAGIRFAGRRIGRDGLWRGALQAKRETIYGGNLNVRLRPYSEALVTLR